MRVSVKTGLRIIDAVVIALAVVLTSTVLLSALAEAGERSTRVVCLSNLKKLNLALMQYVQDNDDRMIPWIKWSDAGPVESPRMPGWYPPANSMFLPNHFLKPFVKDSKAFHCPLDNGNRWWTRDVQWHLYDTSYFFSLEPHPDFPPGIYGLSLLSITQPQRTVTLYEANFPWGDSYHDHGLEWEGEWDKRSPSLLKVHGSNVGYADGHVKWTMPEKVLSGLDKDDADPSTCYKWGP